MNHIRDEAQSFIRGVEGGSAHTEATTKAEYEVAQVAATAVSYTHLRAHETVLDLVCRLLLEKKKKQKQ